MQESSRMQVSIVACIDRIAYRDLYACRGQVACIGMGRIKKRKKQGFGSMQWVVGVDKEKKEAGVKKHVNSLAPEYFKPNVSRYYHNIIIS